MAEFVSYRKLLLRCLSASMLVATTTSADPPSTEDRVTLRAVPFPLDQVEVTEGPFRHAQDLNTRYLLELEPDRLLAGFRREAGLAPRADVYGGWESESLAGHTLGHYLTACSLGYRTTGDARLKERVDYIVAELSKCQAAHGDGYIAAIPEGKQMFQQVKAGDIRTKGFDMNGVWSPWYTMHKTYAGLRDAHQLCGNEQAKEVLVRLADWCWDTVGDLTDEQAQQMLRCEFGGMNEEMANLFAMSSDPRYWELASRVFHHHAVLDPLAAGQDRLQGHHSNTQVPKVIGVAKMYELTGDEKLRELAEFFWRRVVYHHTYVNGGNSSHEYFGPPGRLSNRLGQTTETCNTYNMLKLTRQLFSWSPQSKHFDFYERAMWNHILAHQHPETGMFVYKGFLEPGGRKGFSHPTNSFWCCVGSGLENHVKYNDSLYFQDEQGLYVNLFVPSRLNWKRRGVVVTQTTGMPTEGSAVLRFACEQPVTFTLRIRHPAWAGDAMTLSVNGESSSRKVGENGYYEIEREWNDGDRVQLGFPLELRVETTPDDPDTVALLYGPVLLCADLGQNKTPPVLVSEPDQIAAAFQPTDRPLEFVAKSIGRSVDVSPQLIDHFGEAETVRLVPHFAVTRRRYSVYLERITPSDWPKFADAEQRRLSRLRELSDRTVDAIRIGEMQPERNHNLKSMKSNVGQLHGQKWRDAQGGGWFSFELKTLPHQPMQLQCTYWGEESPERVFQILVDGTPIAKQILGRDRPGKFYDVLYDLPEDVTADKQKVTVRFQASPDRMAGGLFGICRMLKKEDAAPSTQEEPSAGR